MDDKKIKEITLRCQKFNDIIQVIEKNEADINNYIENQAWYQNYHYSNEPTLI